MNIKRAQSKDIWSDLPAPTRPASSVSVEMGKPSAKPSSKVEVSDVQIGGKPVTPSTSSNQPAHPRSQAVIQMQASMLKLMDDIAIGLPQIKDADFAKKLNLDPDLLNKISGISNSMEINENGKTMTVPDGVWGQKTQDALNGIQQYLTAIVNSGMPGAKEQYGLLLQHLSDIAGKGRKFSDLKAADINDWARLTSAYLRDLLPLNRDFAAYVEKNPPAEKKEEQKLPVEKEQLQPLPAPSSTPAPTQQISQTVKNTTPAPSNQQETAILNNLPYDTRFHNLDLNRLTNFISTAYDATKDAAFQAFFSNSMSNKANYQAVLARQPTHLRTAMAFPLNPKEDITTLVNKFDGLLRPGVEPVTGALTDGDKANMLGILASIVIEVNDALNTLYRHLQRPGVPFIMEQNVDAQLAYGNILFSTLTNMQGEFRYRAQRQKR